MPKSRCISFFFFQLAPVLTVATGKKMSSVSFQMTLFQRKEEKKKREQGGGDWVGFDYSTHDLGGWVAKLQEPKDDGWLN